MTDDQIKAKQFLQERLDSKNAELARARLRLEWRKKADDFLMKKMAEFHQSGQFGPNAAFEAGRKAKAELLAIYGPCPPTEYELFLRANV